MTGLSIIDFAHQVETDLGVAPNANDDLFFEAWQRAEGNPGVKENNPFNISNGVAEKYGGSAGSLGAGIGAFPSADVGASATAAYIAHNAAAGGMYQQFLADLKAGADPTQTAVAIGSSPWASGHYDPTDPKPLAAVDHGTEPGHTIISLLGKGSAADVVGAAAGALSPSSIASTVGGFLPSIGTDAKSVAIFAVLLAGGVGLLLLGGWRFAEPTVHKVTEAAAPVAGALAA